MRLLRNQLEELRARHLAQHAGRHRVGLVVIVDVDVQPVHHIEMRVGKQLFHGRVAHFGTHTGLHEGLEIRLRGQALHILQRGQWDRLATGMATACGLAMTRSRVVAICAKRVWRRCRNITRDPVWRIFASQTWQSAVSRIFSLDRLPLAP